MYETLVKGVAGVGSVKCKIIVFTVIAVCVAMCAFLMPVQVYAMGNLMAELVGALAGLIASYAAGPMASAAVVAMGITAPELAAFLLCCFVAVGVSITVTMACNAFMNWWENGGNADTLIAMHECWDNVTKSIKATPAKFALLTYWIKYDLLKLPLPDSSGGKTDVKSLPQGEFIDSASCNFDDNPNFTYNYENHGLNYTINSNIRFGTGAFQSGLTYIITPKDNLNLSARLDLCGNWTYNTSHYNLVFNLYDPKINITDDGSVTITDRIFNTHNGKPHSDSENGINKCYIRYNNLSENTFIDWPLRYDNGKIVHRDVTKNKFILNLYDGQTKDTFNSLDEFIYDLIYNTSSFIYDGRTYKGTAGFVSPSYEEYYSESRDVISATASVINKKLESGDITDETEGVISVGMVGNAVKDIAGVADGALSDTVITDVALPTQVTADKTATDAGVKTPGNISAAFSQAGNAIMQGGATLGDKFPFDAIKAATKWLQTLVQPGKPLVIDFQYDIPIVGTVDVHLDYSDKQKEVDIINWLVIVMVCLGCYAVTRDRLKTI